MPILPDLLVLHMENAEELLRHPKDAGLLAALRMLDDRLAELPGEIPNAPPIPPEVIELATRVMTGAKTARIGLRPNADLSRGEVPFYGRLHVHAGGLQQFFRLAHDHADLIIHRGNGCNGFEIHAPLERRAHRVHTLVDTVGCGDKVETLAGIQD